MGSSVAYSAVRRKTAHKKVKILKCSANAGNEVDHQLGRQDHAPALAKDSLSFLCSRAIQRANSSASFRNAEKSGGGVLIMILYALLLFNASRNSGVIILMAVSPCCINAFTSL